MLSVPTEFYSDQFGENYAERQHFNGINIGKLKFRGFLLELNTKYFRSLSLASFDQSQSSRIRMCAATAVLNNYQARMGQTNLVVKFILCLIVPAYHTIQAELGKLEILYFNPTKVQGFEIII